jgi:FAD synthase
VYIALREEGITKPTTYSIGRIRTASGEDQCLEYQLLDMDGRLYKNGMWIREGKLRARMSSITNV